MSSEVQVVKAEPVAFFLSELIRARVVQVRGGKMEEVGRLVDLEITQNGGYPEVVNLIVGRSFGRAPLEVPFSMVASIAPHRAVLEVPGGMTLKEFAYDPMKTLIKDMVLDKKIIDTDDYEVEVVYDIRLLHAEGRMHVVHVDVSTAGMLRRLHFGWLGRLLWGPIRDTDLLPWRYVQPLPSDLGRFRGDVRLTISREKIADIHPADLADILEELSGDERMAVFDTLDTETAADTLEEAEPRVQRELVASMRRDRLVELFQTMTAAQIAGILEILPRIDSQVLRRLLPAETAVKVAELLNEPDVELESIVTNRFLVLPGTALAGEALSCFRDRTRRYDVVMYVYITSQDGTLVGAIDIRELIQAEETTPLRDIMTEQVVTLSPKDALADAAVEFADHGFRALPIVDENHRLLGVVTYKDLLAVMK